MNSSKSTFAAAVLLLLSLVPVHPASAQSTRYDWEISPYAGALLHQVREHRETHPIFGVRAIPYPTQPVTVGLDLAWWPDRFGLGPLYNGRRVNADYFSYTLKMQIRLASVLGEEGAVFATAGAGGETLLFGERFEATGILPKDETSPAGSIGLGTRIPLIRRERSILLLRLDAQARAVNAKVVSLTGEGGGRDLDVSPSLTFGLSYLVR